MVAARWRRRVSPIGRFQSLYVVVLLSLTPCPMLSANDMLRDPHAIIQRMASGYDRIRDYTALFLKRERVDGTLLPLETIELRFQAPFKIYMAWRTPHAGRVIVFVEGENDSKILVNPGGFLGFLRLKLDPKGSRATRDAHLTIREAGLQQTIALIMHEYERGRQEGQATLLLQGDEIVAGRPTYHLTLLCHADRTAGYYAQRTEIWIDKKYFLPIKLALYDWDNQLYASYEYQQLRLNPGLGPEAFRLKSPLDETPQPPEQ